MGLRTIVRKLRKPVVMALVAGSLALSLTVTTTQKAEAVPAVAVAPVIAAAESVLAGGVRLALPSLFAVALGVSPVGWVLAGGAVLGAAIGVGLYSTKDYWLPFVAGAFGGAAADAAGATGGNYRAGMKITEVTALSARQMNAKVEVPTNISGTFTISSLLSCQHNTTGVIRQVSAYNEFGFTNAKIAGTGPACATGETVIGWRFGAPGSHPSLLGGTSTGAGARNGPENVVQGGTLLQGGFDPKGADVKYKTTVECIDDGGNKSTITADWFGDEGGAKVPSCAAAGKGHGTGKMSVEGYAPTAPGQVGTVPETVWGAEAPPVDENHPLCGPNRPGPGCTMAITIDGKPCTVGAWECENWTEIWKDPTTAPRVGCTFGPYTLAVDLCTVMEPAYRPGGAPATEENMDGQPATRNYTQPGGQTYQPPQTGTGTGTGTIPGIAGAPGAGSTPEEAGCFPTGWAALNPVEWVMKPVGCALTAAFVPKPEVVQAQQTRIQTKFQNVGFARITDAWLATFESVGGGSGCAGPTVNFSMQGVGQSLQPFNACTAPMSTVAGITYAVSAIGIVLFGGLGMIRAVGSAFGFNFTLGKGASE